MKRTDPAATTRAKRKHASASVRRRLKGPSGEHGSLNRGMPERATREIPRSMGKSPAVRRSSVQRHWAYAIAQTPIKKTMRRNALLNVGGVPVFISTRAEERADISLSRTLDPTEPREAF